MRCLFCVRSHQIPLIFERPQRGRRSNLTHVPSGECRLFTLFEKCFFYICIPSLCAVMAASVFMQHRLLTASVSHGGPFFALLPSCVLQSILCFCSKTKNRAFFLLAMDNGRALIERLTFPGAALSSGRWFIAFLLPPSVGFESEGFLCILYGVGLTTTCPLGSGGDGYVSNWVPLLPCMADLWRMGHCRRRWMNGSLAGIMVSLAWFELGGHKGA